MGYCYSCGAELTPGTKFCANCGAAVAPQQTQAQAQPQQSMQAAPQFQQAMQPQPQFQQAMQPQPQFQQAMQPQQPTPQYYGGQPYGYQPAPAKKGGKAGIVVVIILLLLLLIGGGIFGLYMIGTYTGNNAKYDKECVEFVENYDDILSNSDSQGFLDMLPIQPEYKDLIGSKLVDTIFDRADSAGLHSEIENVKVLSQEDIEKVKSTSPILQFAGDLDVSEGYDITMTSYYTVNGNKISEPMHLVIGKVDGKWYLLDYKATN